MSASTAATAREHDEGAAARHRDEAAVAVEPFEGSAKKWDALVHQSVGATFCHLAGWRDLIEDVFGHEWLAWTALARDGKPCGILPVVRVRTRLLGHRLVSMPFLNYGGPLGDEAARTALTETAVAEASRSGADLLEVRARDAVPGDLPAGRSKLTVLLDLPESAETLWHERFSSKLRNQIRRPRKAGMEARFGRDEIEPFYEVFSRHMRDLGTPVLPRDFFHRAAHVFADRIVFAAVYRRGRPVASGCGFIWRDEFEITWASSLREYKREAPNMLLYWSLMKCMIGRGIRVFNFGRCTPGGGTHRFKRQWGGADVTLPWVQWSARAGAALPSPDRRRFRAAAAVWRRLPLAFTRRVGPRLARGLP